MLESTSEHHYFQFVLTVIRSTAGPRNTHFEMACSQVVLGVFSGALPPGIHSHVEASGLTSCPILPLSLMPKPCDGCGVDSRAFLLVPVVRTFWAANRGGNRMSEIDGYRIFRTIRCTPPKIWEEKGVVSYSPNVVYLACWEGGVGQGRRRWSGFFPPIFLL